MYTPWLTSLAEFSSIITPVLEMVNPRQICEIGASAGTHSKILGDFLRKRQGRLISIDPRPQQSFLEWAKVSGDIVTHISEPSLSGLKRVEIADAWFLDGDHNWYTVYHELIFLENLSLQNNFPLLIFLHDLNWPCARRDMYYDPSRIPAEYLHPHSADISFTIDNPGVVENGFKGGTWALQEGGPRNGILTAVEDFLQQSKIKFHQIHVPAILGLGVLVDVKHPFADRIIEYYKPYHNNPLIARLERDRVEKYLAICSLNEKFAKLASVFSNLNKICEAENIKP